MSSCLSIYMKEEPNEIEPQSWADLRCNLLIIVKRRYKGRYNGNNRCSLIGKPMFHYVNLYSTEEPLVQIHEYKDSEIF